MEWIKNNLENIGIISFICWLFLEMIKNIDIASGLVITTILLLTYLFFD